MSKLITERYKQYIREEEALLEKKLLTYYKEYGKKNVIQYTELLRSLTKQELELFYTNIELLKKSNIQISKIKGFELLYNKSHDIQRLDLLRSEIAVIKKAFINKGGQELFKLFNFRKIPVRLEKNIKKDTYRFLQNRAYIDTNKIADHIIKGTLRGEDFKKTAYRIKNEYGVSIKKAKLLVRTEGTKIQTYQNLINIKKEGFKKYMYIAHDGCCSYCRSLDRKTFYIKDAEFGDLTAVDTASMRGNIPPLHPGCRCVIMIPESES